MRRLEDHTEHGPDSISVVVPTYERMDVLPEVLDALEQQRGVPEFEVIVVDDGSKDDTRDYLEQRVARREPTDAPSLEVVHQVNRGPAAARNAGVERAAGELVVFLGDDTVPEPDWLSRHLGVRSRGSEREAGWETLAVIGYTRWHERMRLNPFLRYINDFGLQFGYALIDDPRDVPFNFFYTSNLSLPRRLLLEEPFDTRFPYPAWEDIELSYRLKSVGMRLRYEPSAIVQHDHPTTLSRFAQRQEKAGYCAVVFHQRHPELGGFLGLGPEGPPAMPSAAAHRLRWLLARALQNMPVSTPTLWETVLRYYYIAGLRRGWSDRHATGSRDLEISARRP